MYTHTAECFLTAKTDQKKKKKDSQRYHPSSKGRATIPTVGPSPAINELFVRSTGANDERRPDTGRYH